MKNKIKELRELTHLSRKEFCRYYHIPYQTLLDWENDNRHAPAYVVNLLEYAIKSELLLSDTFSHGDNFRFSSAQSMIQEPIDTQRKITELRKLTAMNRAQFCSYFGIPYATVYDWEKGSVHAPDYVMNLMEYYIANKLSLVENVLQREHYAQPLFTTTNERHPLDIDR